ncbi:MAG: hypothetical protein C4521_00225 [Actinobacteria bacterium]|nr:MAG: hypothetical protein C4521_00225 [Actinomycetota bacterium]
MNIEVNSLLHGFFGTVFLILFAWSAELLWDLKPERVRRLKVVVSLIVASVVIHNSWGTYIYQFYRADTPDSPRSLILASDNLRWLHTILMEYKEFVAGFVPILTIAALFAIFYYGDDLLPRRGVRIAILIILAVAFAFALMAFGMGVLITKYAPLGGGVLQ